MAENTTAVVTRSPRDITLRVSDVISGDFGSYQIKALKGEGTYARVAWCVDLSTKQNVAIKVSRINMARATVHEAYVLRDLSSLSGDKNVVKFIKAFRYQDHYCLVLEHLDRSLYDFLYEREFKPLHISQIRHIAEQLLVTFKELGKRGLVHGDLKPDNIMLVNQKDAPFRVKLIDFGISTRVSSMVPGIIIQALGYRAPEVLLGTQMSEAIDMWGLGCVLAFLYQGQNLFPHHCEYENMRIVTQVRGLPDPQLLRKGLFTHNFFSCNSDMTGSDQYELITREKYIEKTGKLSMPCRNASYKYTCLEDMRANHPQPQTQAEKEDTKQFFNLLNQLLQVNPTKRITASEALNHPFISQKTPSKSSLTQYLRSISWSSTPCDDGDKSAANSSDLSDTEPQCFFAYSSNNKLRKVKDRVPTGWSSNARASNNSGKTSRATILNKKLNIDKGTGGGSTKPSRTSKSTALMTNEESSANPTKTLKTGNAQSATQHITAEKNNTSVLGRMGNFIRKVFRTLTCTCVPEVDE